MTREEEFIEKHKDGDVRKLALKMPEGMDALWCMRQIEGYQKAKTKIPSWAETNGVWFPVTLSMEQCSSEVTARYKASLIADYKLGVGSMLVDMTGGLGVDFSFMAPLFEKAIYVERNEELCNLAKHNLPLLAVNNAEVINGDETEIDNVGLQNGDLVFIDPARRDNIGRKVAGLKECSPDVTEIVPKLLEKRVKVMLKLSPMLDITQALRELPGEWEIHVVSVEGECKELLLLSADNIYTHAINIVDGKVIDYYTDETDNTPEYGTPESGYLLFEPNASILKAGIQNYLSKSYGIKKINKQSNLFVGKEKIPNGLCRIFTIEEVFSFSKSDIKKLQQEVKKANITVRNFPLSVVDVRKKLKIKEGGDVYLFATTLLDESHCIIKCKKL